MRRNKKGFTVVELSIVIVVIAILAAILIPTMISLVNKANVANDTALVRNLNTALALDGGEKHETMQDALDAAKDAGYDVAKINAKATDNEILWDSANDVFCYMKDEDGKQTITYVPETTLSVKNVKDYQYWVVASAPSSTYSTYLYNYSGNGTENITTGIDVGSESVSNITYTSTVAQDVILRTQGGKLTINDTNDASHQYHYGVADEVMVATGSNCFETHGAIGKLTVNAGKAIAGESGIAFVVEAKNEGVALEEKDGGKFVIPSDTTTDKVSISIASSLGYTIDGLTDNSSETTYANAARTNGNYQIGTLKQLENFRDLVNGGFTFAGLTVELTSDITLEDGWVPIGEGCRDFGATDTIGSYVNTTGNYSGVFCGTFEGSDHTISNLNANGYKPRTKFINSSEKVFIYGFFGILAGNATVKNLKFDNVNINLTGSNFTTEDGTINELKADSVGALVGYCGGSGNITIEKIEVSGSVKASDGVGGIIGRSYAGTTIVKSCQNSATVEGAKAAGIFGYANKGNLVVENNINSGNISTSAKGAGIVVFALGSDANGKSITIKSNKNSGTITQTASITTKVLPEISYIAQGGSGGNLDNSNGKMGSSDNYLSSWNLTDNTNNGGKLICKNWNSEEIILSNNADNEYKKDFIIRGQAQITELNGYRGTKSAE